MRVVRRGRFRRRTHRDTVTSHEPLSGLMQGRGMIIHALVALTYEAADGAIQGDQRQVQDFRLPGLGGCQPSIASDQAQADRDMDIGDREPGGVVVGRVDKQRGRAWVGWSW